MFEVIIAIYVGYIFLTGLEKSRWINRLHEESKLTEKNK